RCGLSPFARRFRGEDRRTAEKRPPSTSWGTRSPSGACPAPGSRQFSDPPVPPDQVASPTFDRDATLLRRFCRSRSRRSASGASQGREGKREMVSIEELVQQLVERGGSDLHISAGAPPMIRVSGRLVATEQEVLDAETTQKLVYSILDNEQILRFEKEWELDMSFGIAGLGRFRTNVFYQRGAVGAVLRVIPYDIKTMVELDLPTDVCERLCALQKGLVLVTGATGSGKSTTLASMIDHINRSRNDHIMIIEDPIDVVHRNKCCLINQREVGTDTRGFAQSLRTVLRQDPDVIMVGELRDQETIAAALTIAE